MRPRVVRAVAWGEAMAARNRRIGLRDRVRIVEEIPSSGDDVLTRGAPAGAVGCVVHVQYRPRRRYEVEIPDERGGAWSLVSVGPGQIEPVGEEAPRSG